MAPDCGRNSDPGVPCVLGLCGYQKRLEHKLIYQLGWTTLPGLRGLSCSDFRAVPTTAPDNERGVAIEFADDAERDAFARLAEDFFAPRRFTNAADAFDTVKAYVLEHAAKRNS
jgi:hypothetical protein